METHKIVQGIGVVLFAIGAVLAFVGTTSTGLFVFYGVLAVAGIGVMTLGKKMGENASTY